ncbi:hypothetical protein EU534_00450 [Candidatus Heimdallarchaeota archaeon]|nr:MAG: hypothetical protein EU534_00450 [Candidatus Heimdallarchaeota archaeon]
MSFDEIMKIAQTREQLYNNVKGLKQIIYMKDERINEYSSVLIFEDAKSLNDYRTSTLAQSIQETYSTNQPPEIRIYDLIKEIQN